MKYSVPIKANAHVNQAKTTKKDDGMRQQSENNPYNQLHVDSLPSNSLLQLQRTIGNQAVEQLFRAQQVMPPSPSTETEVAQRTPIFHKPTAETALTSDVEKELWDIAQKIDDEVNSAYTRFMTGDYNGASQAQIDLYTLRKYEFDNNSKSMHPSTAAGYVIEGMVNSVINGMDGVEIQVTNLLDGTRPDVLITLPSGEMGLLDITASKSAGHILGKKGNWLNHQNIPLVIESVYPSIDFRNMTSQTLSTEDLARIQERMKHDAEMKILMEEQRQAHLQESYQQRQNVIYEKLMELKAAYDQNNDRDVLPYRINSRSQENFRKIGLDVSIDSQRNHWEITRIDYSVWNEQNNESFFSIYMGLRNFLNTKLEMMGFEPSLTAKRSMDSSSSEERETKRRRK
ncbi:hypothetical protein [Bacillus horti]|uniref:Uncharacterized protein n=1 Tax=Caldalkalibacillus horti TaxID=77523 RepID=A0ABT9W3V1_9BACI|nr:hypothetical protein [Bacillus horti]MDQ0167935.1 hypothetical protein [Bacillus horti]